LRGQDSNLRPSGYEPDELPGCSTPREARSLSLAGPVVSCGRGVVLAVACLLPRFRGARRTRRRPALPRLGTQYHGRGGVSRPSSGRGRVGHPRCGRRVGRASRGRPAGAGWGGGACCWRAAWVGGCARPAAGLPPGRGSSLGRLGPVGCARRRACTPGLSTWWSATALMARPGLAVGFPLRCLQRLSRPRLATRRRGWRHDRSTRGASAPVLSY
jgi:hypothetical protein